MERYITIMPNSAAVRTAIDNQEMGKPYISYLEDEHRIDWNTLEPEHDYSSMYLTFEIISGGTIVWRHGTQDYAPKTIEYSKDSGTTWTSITPTTAGTSFNVDAGDKVMFRGNNLTYGHLGSGYETADMFGSAGTAVFNVYGNIMSLIDSTGFTNMTALTSVNAYAFRLLFYGAKVVSAEHLILPALNLSGATNCYNGMFYGCTSLTTAPELPATTLYQNCYAYMFYNCTSLTTITCLATDISARNCLSNWVRDVAANGTFTKHPNMSSWPSGKNGIPTGWTVQDAVL